MAETIFGKTIPILSEEEFNNKTSGIWQKREKGDPIAILSIMYHIATHAKDKSAGLVLGIETMMLEDGDGDIDEELLEEALEEISEALESRLASLERGDAAAKQASFDASPQYTANGEIPNAVLVYADGSAALIRLKGFVDRDDLSEPLDCSRVSMVYNRLPGWAEQKFGFKVVGLVDESGIPKGLSENERIQMLSGYDYIAGDCLLVGIDDQYNYLPLSPADALTVFDYFR